MPTANPLLTTLCSVCHTNPPRYTCPRCGARSCSLACVRRHKSRAACSGIRDVTAFVPAARLKTPAGIDHDYNFLTAIERARARAEREIVDERGIFASEKELRARGDGLREQWRGDVLRFVEYPRAGGVEEAGGREEGGTSRRRVRRRCRLMGVGVEEVPRGMMRHRENTTAWNGRTDRINWQVEWVYYEEGVDRPPTRILRKALEEVPLYQAFTATMEWLIRGQEMATLQGDDEDGPPRKKRRRRHHKKEPGSAQDARSQRWERTPYPSQNPITGTWDLESESTATTWIRDADEDAKRYLQFFLLKPRSKPKALIPFDAHETLADVLPGRTIIEFPTVFVLPTGSALPSGHTLGSTERQIPDPPSEPKEEPEPKAKTPHGLKRSRSPAAKKGRLEGPASSRPTSLKRSRSPKGQLDSPEYEPGTRGAFRQLVSAMLDDDVKQLERPSKKRRVTFAPIQEIDDGEIDSDGEAIEAASDTSSEGVTSEEDESVDLSSSSESGPEEVAATLNGKAKLGLGLVGYDSSDEE